MEFNHTWFPDMDFAEWWQQLCPPSPGADPSVNMVSFPPTLNSWVLAFEQQADGPPFRSYLASSLTSLWNWLTIKRMERLWPNQNKFIHSNYSYFKSKLSFHKSQTHLWCSWEGRENRSSPIHERGHRLYQQLTQSPGEADLGTNVRLRVFSHTTLGGCATMSA